MHFHASDSSLGHGGMATLLLRKRKGKRGWVGLSISHGLKLETIILIRLGPSQALTPCVCKVVRFSSSETVICVRSGVS